MDKFSLLRFCSAAAWLCFAVTTASAEGAATQPAHAAPKAAATAKSKSAAKTKPAAKNPETQAAIARANQLLASGKREDIEAGIQSLGLLGTREAVDPLSARIRAGLPPELLDVALLTLTALSQPNAGPVLYELAAHRRPEVRLRAIEAIVACKPAGAEQALVLGLSDDDPKVRAAAATGLGEVGARGALEKLFLALDRGNLEASGAIGRVIAPNDVPRLVRYLGQLPFHNLGPALAQVFQRGDVPEATKLEIVTRLEEVGTSEVKGYLGDLVSASGQSISPNVSKALLHAMQEIAD